MNLRLRGKLFLLSLGLITLSVLIAYVFARSEIEEDVTSRVRADLVVRGQLVASDASNSTEGLSDVVYWDTFADRVGTASASRVTIVSLEGEVVGDSLVDRAKLADLDNHAARPEISVAFEGKVGQSQRYSSTVNREMLYVAMPLRRDGEMVGVARVAMALTQLDSALEGLRQALIIAAVLAIVIALGIASFAAELASRKVRLLTDSAKQMAGGNLEVRTRVVGTDEFTDLGHALDGLATSLDSTLGELREERDRLSGILESMEEGVLFLDQQGRVALVNPVLREMLLLSGDEVGKSLLEAVRNSELSEVLGGVEVGRTSEREIEITGLKPCRLLVRAVRLEGAQKGVLAVFVDVTETRQLENMRKQFVANVSHELRTPVTAIRSAGESMQAALTSRPEMVERLAAIIERNSERLQALVEDLLDLSKIESRQYSPRLETLDLGAVIEVVMELFSERAQKQDTKLVFDQTERPLVRGDRRALQHVISNLLDNAVKYAGAGESVTVSAGLEEGRVALRVKDTGPGIPEEHLGRLFERFYRVDEGRSRDLGGTGLGLSIVKHLTESMGGAVRVESVVGEGATFVIRLPAPTEGEGELASSSDAEPPHSSPLRP